MSTEHQLICRELRYRGQCQLWFRGRHVHHASLVDDRGSPPRPPRLTHCRLGCLNLWGRLLGGWDVLDLGARGSHLHINHREAPGRNGVLLVSRRQDHDRLVLSIIQLRSLRGHLYVDHRKSTRAESRVGIPGRERISTGFGWGVRTCRGLPVGSSFVRGEVRPSSQPGRTERGGAAHRGVANDCRLPEERGLCHGNFLFRRVEMSRQRASFQKSRTVSSCVQIH